MLKKIRHEIGRRYNAFKAVYDEYNLIIKHLGSSLRSKSLDKERAYLLMELHTIEKGLSLKEIKIGFGQPRVIHILNLTISYLKNFQDYTVLNYVLAPISEYISFHAKHNFKLNEQIFNTYNQVIKLKEKKLKNYGGGTLQVTKKEILKASEIDFETFAKNRFSIRNFTGKPVAPNKIYKALKIAEKTPSPCNRQPWKNYVVFDKRLISEIVTIQQGGRQFKDDLACIIVVTSSYTHFFGAEHHQPQVSGGMYAMSLIYALHSLGLGTISLNLGIAKKKLNAIYKILGITHDNSPILIIGIGDISEDLKVAYAERFDYEDYTVVFESSKSIKTT